MDDWDELIDNILVAYRSSRQDSTKCTPFLFMYGREARLATYSADSSNIRALWGWFWSKGKTHGRVPSKTAFKCFSKNWKKPRCVKRNIMMWNTTQTQNWKSGTRCSWKIWRMKGGKVASWTSCFAEDLGKGRYRLKDGKGDLMKTAINCHRLKLWLDPDGGRLKPQKVCMHVIYTYVHMCLSRLVYWIVLYVFFGCRRQLTTPSLQLMTAESQERELHGGSGNPLPPNKRAKVGSDTCRVGNAC